MQPSIRVRAAALANIDGEIIGLNTAIASHSGNNSGVAFSIPINMVKKVVRNLLDKGVVSRGYLGLQVAPSFESADAQKLGLERLQGLWLSPFILKLLLHLLEFAKGMWSCRLIML